MQSRPSPSANGPCVHRGVGGFPPSTAFDTTAVRIAAVILAVANLWFFSALPVVGLAGSVHDDQLFLQLADSISRGNWLGIYSRFTLMKGCGYPLFIAGSLFAGVPLPLAEHGLYVLGCWLVIRALRPCLPNRYWALAGFAVLLWQPMSYWLDPTGGNVLRQNLYTPLTLLVFAGLIAITTRQQGKTWARMGWASLLGLSLGWMWITREETVWIAPSVLLLASVGLLATFRSGHLQRSLAELTIAAGCALVPVLAVCSLNARHYGWFGTVEFRAPEFIGAYAAITRVRPPVPRRRVPAPRETRELIYQVSPAFARLRPLLEGEMGVRWSDADRQFNGGMWMWAFREAVDTAVQPRDARAALAYYQKLAGEVNAACEDGRLPAAGRHHGFVPPWTWDDTSALLRDAPSYFRFFVTFDGFNVRPAPSSGTAAELRIFRDMTQWFVARGDQSPELTTPQSRALQWWRIGALNDAGHLLRWVCVALVIAGATAWVAAGLSDAFRRRMPALAWWLASSAFLGAMAVFAISLLVHVTSWADWRPLRFAQAYPLLLLGSLAALANGWSLVSTRWAFPLRVSTTRHAA